MDANVKTNHYQNCGRATTAAYRGFSPLYGIYFGRGPQAVGAVAGRLISELGGLRGDAGGGPWRWVLANVCLVPFPAAVFSMPSQPVADTSLSD